MSFRITDIDTRKTQLYPNRDELLLGLEMTEKRCEALGESAHYLIEHLDRDEETVLENLTFSLPYAGVIDDLLAEFGLKAETKTSPLSVLTDKSKGKKGKTASESPSQHQATTQKAATRRPSRLGGLLVLLALLLAVAGLAFSSLAFGQLASLKAENQSLTEQVESLEDFEQEKSQIDVFARYFMPNYYANSRDGVADFVSSDLENSIDVSEGTLQSVILESMERDGKTTTVTYVLVVKDADDNRTSVRLTFDVVKDSKATYGYLVTSQPESAKYPTAD